MSERLDKVLVLRGLVESREKGRAAIEAGLVCVDGEVITVNKHLVNDESVVTIEGNSHYVSRAAEKLKGAITQFQIDLKNKKCIDIGASTGGFTQVCLEEGATCVIALDVGSDQLHSSLKEDDRVFEMEKYNFRYASREDFPFLSDFFCSDVSFISLKHIIPSILECVEEECEGVLLIKPQFEAGNAFINKHGVVKDRKVHIQVIQDIIQFATLHGFGAVGLAKSTVVGKKGNQEYLLYIRRGAIGSTIDIKSVVD